MPSPSTLLCALPALLFACGATAADLPVITWVHTPQRSGEPPAERGNGTDEDAVRTWLIDRLTGYRHVIVVADGARMAALFKSTDGVCYPMLVETDERRGFIAFSDRLLRALPARIIVLEAQSSRLAELAGPAETLDLERLVAEPELTGAYAGARAFSPSVDAILARYRDSGRLVEMAQGQSVYAMLAAGRVGWVVGYPSEAREVFGREYPAIATRSFGIAGNTALLASFAGCSNQPLGMQIIADINALLREQRRKDPLQPLYDSWIGPSDRSALDRAMAADGPADTE